ncbi:MAG TPA: MBL fold metallo-hydrolase [Bacteroidales bacterium]|jgi:glyoxylase-like metal-dependent hydrolase (beta-lactamase superfamily II)|nr:MBL fold metallo-hydrolase [Bacteroidales bacterium]
MKINLFNIVNFGADGGAMFGVIPKAMWSRVYRANENNLITLALRSLVVETDGHVILVDTGWGDKQDEKFFRHLNLHGGDGLAEGLKKCGYDPKDITDVVLTHLHADHCGGGVVKSREGSGFELAFPDALFHVSRVQWEWAVKNNPREEDSFLEENILPILDSGHLNLVEEDCELFEGFSVRFCFGHTPGLMIPVVKYHDQTLVFAGDLIPTVSHIPLLWNMSYDIESLKTIDEKGRLLEEALRKNYILVFQHDEFTECCTLEMTPKGIRAGERFEFAAIKKY